MAKAPRTKGAGSIYERGEGKQKRFIAQVQDGYKENGKPQYRQVRCRTKEEAQQAINEMIAKKVNGTPIPSGKSPTLAKWLDTWLKDFIEPHREPKTHDFYKLHIEARIKPHLGTLDLRKIRPRHVNAMMTALEREGVGRSTQDATRRTLRAAMTVAMKLEYCGDNPVTKTFAPKVTKKPIVYFDAKQVNTLLEALEGSPIENLVKFSLATGMRIGESTGVTWENFDADSNTLRLTQQLQRAKVEGRKKKALKPKALKSEKSRRPMPLLGLSLEVVLAEQQRQIDEGFENPLNLIFLNPLGRPFDQKYVNKYLHLALEKAELTVTGMHSFRHSAATFMLMDGLNLHQVSRYIGHSQVSLTSNLYGHVLETGMREAAERLQSSITNRKVG